jgi:hypothetical protein
VQGARHEYHERRALVDAIPVDILCLAPSALGAHVAEAREALMAAVPTPVE